MDTNIYLAIFYIIIAYFVGNLDFAYIFVKLHKGSDIRDEGSGNAGTANVLRTHGKGLAIAVFAGDFLKGLLIVLIGKWIGLNGWWLMAAALAVVVGHNWPVLLKFKGGKGVATTIGVLCALDFQVGIYPLVLGLSLAFITKIIAIGSIVGVCSFPIFDYIYTGTSDIYVLSLSIVLAILNLIQHRENIYRIFTGKENTAIKEKK